MSVLEGLRLVHQGKVRQLYEVDQDTLLMVASDRISAFDVVMEEQIPHKGRVLTAMTAYWDQHLSALAPTHLVSADPDVLGDRTGLSAPDVQAIAGRSLLVRRAEMLPMECIVRGYLAGSAAAEYRLAGTVHQMPMPAGLRLGDPLPEPVFTPSTKYVPTSAADAGHDENITFDQAAALVGAEVAAVARDLCLRLYAQGAERCRAAGFILADTKFELGVIGGELAVCDEVLTPDSSRIWLAGEIVPGSTPPAFDKQPLRDWLAVQDWDKRPPPPALPPAVVEETSRRYVEAYERVTGRQLARWYGAAQ